MFSKITLASVEVKIGMSANINDIKNLPASNGKHITGEASAFYVLPVQYDLDLFSKTR